ncbi:MAG: MBL fold metallo-hydrolase [Bacteroidales bacterium]|nr:MBL fold metallo-hydrolase [Bacteroidales bacterium]
MKITFLGTGTSMGVPIIGCKCRVCLSDNPKDKRFRSSVFIETDNKNFIIDTGPDFRIECLNNGVERIDAILITHIHRDHLSGLDDIRPFCYQQKEFIPIYASNSVCKQIRKDFAYCFGENRYPGVPDIELHEISDKDFEVLGTSITPIKIMHAKLEVTAFRFGKFTYITDASYIPEESVKKILGTEYLVVNALRKEPHPSHFTLSQALDLIERVKPKQAFLTHIGHTLGPYDEVQNALPKNVTLAYDGLKLEI